MRTLPRFTTAAQTSSRLLPLHLFHKGGGLRAMRTLLPLS